MELISKFLSISLKDNEIDKGTITQEKWDKLKQDEFFISENEPSFLNNIEYIKLPNQDLFLCKKIYRNLDWLNNKELLFSINLNNIYSRLYDKEFDHIWWINYFVNNLNKPNYIEYGIALGKCINKVCDNCDNVYAVDLYVPKNLNSKIHFYNISTDDFSKENLPNIKFNMAFVDADHKFESAFKDVNNLFYYMDIGGYVFMHDTYPCSEKYLDPKLCNDCYKSPLKIKESWEKDTYELLTLPFNPGLTIIRKLKQPNKL